MRSVNPPRIMHLESVSSTQDVARELPIGSVVLADHQTAGRGRLDHRWEAPPRTALLVSFVLAPNPLLSLAAGVAGLDQPRDQLLVRLRAGIDKWCAAPAERVVARWKELSDTIGRRVRVDLPESVVEGVVQNIDAGGRLIVGGVPISAGAVTFISD